MGTSITTPTDRLIIKYNPEWFKYKSDLPINFPELHYIKCSKIASPESVILGGSYNYYYTHPFYFERCEIFERLFMPYELNTPNFKVRNGILIWPYLNLRSYTDLDDPDCVYIKRQNPISAKRDQYVAMFRFCETHIELHELDTPDDCGADDDEDDKTTATESIASLIHNSNAILNGPILPQDETFIHDKRMRCEDANGEYANDEDANDDDANTNTTINTSGYSSNGEMSALQCHAITATNKSDCRFSRRSSNSSISTTNSSSISNASIMSMSFTNQSDDNITSDNSGYGFEDEYDEQCELEAEEEERLYAESIEIDEDADENSDVDAGDDGDGDYEPVETHHRPMMVIAAITSENPPTNVTTTTIISTISNA
nr:TPA: hypothetical protein [Oryctes rhinoceros nudivirus]